MSENFVKKEEFEALKEEVKEIKQDMIESGKLLQAIDKKIDVISEKLVNNDKVNELKLEPMEKRIAQLEDNQKWLVRTVILEVVGIVCAFIFR